MTDYEVASTLNIIAETHDSRATCIDVANRYVSFEGPKDQEAALIIAVTDFLNSVEYIEAEPNIQMINDNIGWNI